MVKILRKLWHIIISNLYLRPFKKNEYLYLKRVEICNKCINKRHHEVIGDYCDLCGCPLKSKLRVKSEKCKINLW